MIWTLVSAGASLSIPCTHIHDKWVNADVQEIRIDLSVWQLAKNDHEILEALHCNWSPRTHHKFPKQVRDAIKR
jgi:hypothetical protein